MFCSKVIATIILAVICLIHPQRASAGLKKKPENWKPRRRQIIEIESTKTFKDGKTGTEAELAFYSRQFGFVNCDRDRGEFFYFVLKRFIGLKSGHTLHTVSVPLHMLEGLSAFMKVEICRKYLNEPLLRYKRYWRKYRLSRRRLNFGITTYLRKPRPLFGAQF